MKYMLLIIGNQDAEGPTTEPDQGLMEAFMAYHQSVVEAGVIVDSNVLDSFETATSVQVANGERIVTDGPFAETREYLGGYYILDLPDLDAAIDWAGRCPGSQYGRVEIRTIQDFNRP
ncbi:MAG TPA: YciI family protein [Chloroflexota bacterium]|nr:YciI family protein [Chloroflexota bacterium]